MSQYGVLHRGLLLKCVNGMKGTLIPLLDISALSHYHFDERRWPKSKQAKVTKYFYVLSHQGESPRVGKGSRVERQ